MSGGPESPPGLEPQTRPPPKRPRGCDFSATHERPDTFGTYHGRRDRRWGAHKGAPARARPWESFADAQLRDCRIGSGRGS
eukprot:15457965-Alexandrium_andersonii.AAC.1